MVMRYGPRLWKLRVLQAEVRMTIRSSAHSPTTSIRLCLSNENGYYLDIALYKEVTDPSTGQVRVRHRTAWLCAAGGGWGRSAGPLVTHGQAGSVRNVPSRDIVIDTGYRIHNIDGDAS